MEYSAEQRSKMIIEACQNEKAVNPIKIFNHIAKKDFVRIHGPEHHILDGACILTAFYNAGGKIDLTSSLQKLLGEGEKMPGAMCGMWGVCGAVTSIGSALCIIDKTGPLTQDGSWGEHMFFTSKALEKIGKVNGPRCCKRDAFLSMECANEYIESHYGIKLEMPKIICSYSEENKQCLGEKCPYNIKK